MGKAVQGPGKGERLRFCLEPEPLGTVLAGIATGGSGLSCKEAEGTGETLWFRVPKG